MKPSFSVVINTYNRGELLGDALIGLADLDYESYEVVVVNGPSTDDTASVLSAWAGRIKVGHCPEVNLSISRNIGIALANGDVVAFIDDDAVPHPKWLAQLSGYYADSEVGGVGGFTIDNTGVRYQVRKTICDRFGNATNPSDFFDERPLCFPGTPLYPSLLGTNSSFRRTALLEIGGFDHVFAYLLDETDVCLRLVDAGYRIVYEPNALVYHQFAPSHIRSSRRVAKTLYPSAVSKSYFIMRHGARSAGEREAGKQLQDYESEILRANDFLAKDHRISQAHRLSLDDDLVTGIREGVDRAARKRASGEAVQGDLQQLKEEAPFLPMKRVAGLRIVLISRSFPPANEAGIARWTWMMAAGLVRRGHTVHVVTLATGDPCTRYKNGYWIHAIAEGNTEESDRLAAKLDLPSHAGRWCSAVKRQIKRLQTFGVDVVSFPIWDVEGAALLGDPGFGLVMSLHTTYAMARPFKAEWTDRPLFGHFTVDRMISVEKRLLQNVDHILANSAAIVRDLTREYGVDLQGKTVLAPHGTTDPEVSPRRRNEGVGSSLRVLYVGRFERRKGFDIAAAAFAALLRDGMDLEVTFIGDDLTLDAKQVFEACGAGSLLGQDRVKFSGLISRGELDQAYGSNDLVLMPSRYESFGLVAIEAMAASTVVIALAAGGLREVVQHNVTGFLVDPDLDCASAIVSHIRALEADRGRLREMQAAARREYLKRYTVEAMVLAAEPLYYAAAGVER